MMMKGKWRDICTEAAVTCFKVVGISAEIQTRYLRNTCVGH